jgi:hypothetical protein
VEILMLRNMIVSAVVFLSLTGCNSQTTSGEAQTTRTAWQPQAPGGSFSIQLQGNLPRTAPADVFIVDLFDTSAVTISRYQSQGARVICYFSAGSWENWRSDRGNFPKEARGRPLGDWPGEFWLDVSNLNALMPVMNARMDLARRKGCDAVDPDNMDLHTQDTGFSISAQDQIAYARALSEAAHARGLLIGLKNNVEQIPQLVSYFDFAVNESCARWSECHRLRPFISAGRPVYAITYAENPSSVCGQLRQVGASPTIGNRALDRPSTPC